MAAPVTKKCKPATPTVLVVAGLSSSAPFTTTTQRTSQGNNPPHQEWLPWTAKKKETREEFKTFDLVDINGGLWYGVPIFTFWREQVDKGVMLEPDMSSNYIGLYKTHEDTFQIMLTPKPKRPTPKEEINI